MDRYQIKCELARKGFTLTGVARAEGVSLAAVSKVVCGDIASRRIARRIARLLGRPLDDIFPGRYPKERRIVAKGKRRHAA